MKGGFTKKKMTTAIKSVSLSLEFAKLAEDYNISLSEAVRVGVAVILAEKGVTEYVNKTNIGRKINNMALVIEGLSRDLENTKNVLAKVN